MLIGLPYATISMARQWLKALESQQMNNTVMPVASSRENVEDNLVERQKMLQSLLAPRMDTSPPQDYEMRRASSIAVVLRQCHSVMNKDSIANNHDRAAIQILPALIKARILERSRVAMDQSGAAKVEATMVLRSDAGILASVVRSLIEMKAQHRSDRVEALPGAVKGVRSLVGLCECTFGGTDPQFIREMWLLEDALTAAGERVKARGIRQSVLHRLEKYILDVPRGVVSSPDELVVLRSKHRLSGLSTPLLLLC